MTRQELDSGRGIKTKARQSEANNRLFLFQPAPRKSALTNPPAGGESQSNLLSPAREKPFLVCYLKILSDYTFTGDRRVEHICIYIIV